MRRTTNEYGIPTNEHGLPTNEHGLPTTNGNSNVNRLPSSNYSTSQKRRLLGKWFMYKM